MATWQDFIEQFPTAYQSVIETLVSTYEDEFSIGDYGTFTGQSDGTILGQLGSLDETDDFLVALAGYWLGLAAGIPPEGDGGLSAWELLGHKVAIEDAAALKSLELHLTGISVSFATFQAMDAPALAAEFHGAEVSQMYWSTYVAGLRVRTVALDDAEFGPFLLSLPLADRTWVGSFLQMAVAADSGLDLAVLGGLSSAALAGKLQSLHTNPHVRYAWAQRVVVTVRGLMAAHCPDDQLEVQFFGSEGSGMVAGLTALYKSLVAADAVTTVRGLGGLGNDVVAEAILGWNSGHLYFHGRAGMLLSHVRDHLRSVAAAAQLPKTMITFQIRPTNVEARPLGGLLVTVTQPDPSTGLPVEIGTRMLDFHGIANVHYEGSTASPLALTFVVKTGEGETLVTSGSLELDLAIATSIEVEVAVPAVPVVTEGVMAMAFALGLEVPEAFHILLEEIPAETLDELRRNGGLAWRPNAVIQENLALAKRLDAHAALDLLDADAELREFLIDAGYASPRGIAAKSRSSFVSELAGETYGEVTLAGVHLKAGKVDATLSHMLLGKGAEVGSNYKGGTSTSALEQLFSSQCDCEECRSGVSPLAYLAALLDYGTKYIRNNGVAVDVDWFQETFHQGFCELPANCAAVEKKVCQVRIAIEVMRQYMGGVDVAYAHRKHYLETTYGLLLNQCGVTVEEMRLAGLGTGDAALLDSMADRMGVAAAKVAEFHLESTGVSPSLTEDNLELLFGFQSTLRNPYSDGLKEGDSGDDVNSWQFEGVAWGRNTDEDGYLYLKLIAPTRVEVYRDSSRGGDYLVASANVSGASPVTADLVAQNDSGLSGRIELVDAFANSSAISVSVIPRLLAWRLQAQRLRWLGQDFPTGNTYCVENRTLPIVEPDWMGPDDLRHPYTVTGTVRPYDVWKNRREWVDTVMADLAGYGDELDAMFAYMDSSNSYPVVGGGTPIGLQPWDSASISGFSTWLALFDQLQSDLQSSVAGTRAGAIAMIEDDLLLDMDGFARIYPIYVASQVASWVGSAEELADVYAILCMAAKRRYYPSWITEEDAWNVVQGTEQFWAPIHEPKEGKWNDPISWAPFYTTPQMMPWVDPVEVGLLDLPDPGFGNVALNFYQDRVVEVQAKLVVIFDARNVVSYSSSVKYLRMFEAALGAVPSTGYSSYSLLLEDLDSLGTATSTAALGVVNQVLFLTEDEFREGMKVMGMEDNGENPTDAEWQGLAKIILHSWRRGVQWDVWYWEEDNANLGAYWHAYKQRLAKWRSGKEYRRLWLDGLAFYNRVPMVDPDLIKAGDIVNPEFNGDPTLDNPAYVLWRERENLIHHASTGWLTWTMAHDLDENIEEVLQVANGTVTQLWVLYQQNKDVSARMAQLNLTPQRLGLIAKLIDLGSGWSDGDWESFCAIMVQIRKERQYGLWNSEERAAGISLGPDYFHRPHENYLQYHQYLERVLLPWRTSVAARREWQDRLDARIDQEAAVVGGVAAMVKATEDRVLILLRDVLVRQSNAVGHNLEEKGEWLTEKLLMDFRIQCCNETTRVAQAIETLQVLYFSIRVGAIVDDYPLLKLDNDDWDDDWKWLGTYAAWRSLMFVYLYPENVLLPSLKDKKSGKLAELMEGVRNAARFTPDMACEVLHDYEGYLRDMASLQLQATVTTTVHVEADGCGRVTGNVSDVDFLFGLAASGKVYMCTVDAGMTVQTGQSHWEVVKGFEGQHRIVGAQVFETKSGSRYLYLFGLKSVRNDQPTLVANRLNLSTLNWESDLGDLQIDRTSQVETWSLQLAERKNIQDPIFVVAKSFQWLSEWRSWVQGSSTYRIQTTSGIELRDRFVLYNSLNEEGREWKSDDWNKIVFHWLKDFKLAGAIYTNEVIGGANQAFLNVFAAVQFCSEEWRLAYHSFYIDGPRIPMSMVRVVPFDAYFSQDLLVQVPVFAPDTQIPYWNSHLMQVNYLNVQNPDVDAFNAFRSNSAKLKTCCTLPQFVHGINFVLRNPSPHAFAFYYKTKTSASLVNFEMEARSYNCLSPTESNPPGPWSPSIANADRFLSMGVHAVTLQGLNWNSEYLGPFCSHTTVPGISQRLYLELRPANIIFQVDQNLVSNAYLSLLTYGSYSLPPLLEHPSRTASFQRKAAIRQHWINNSLNTVSNRSYLEEAYYLLPMHLAIELQKNKHHEAALELFRLVYDYTLPLADRKIYHGLKAEETITTSFANVLAWLDEPENPHTIAGMRANTHTRFTVFSIVRCMLDMADQEFTADSPESVPRARTLYLAARELIRDEIYELESEGCGALLESLDAEVTDAGWYPEWLRLKLRIAAMNNHDAIDRVVNGIGSGTYPGGIAEVFATAALSWEAKIMAAEVLFQTELDALGSVSNRLCKVVSDWSIRENNIDIVLGDNEIGTELNRMSGQVEAGFLGDLALLTGKTAGELTTEDSLPWLGEALDLSGGGELQMSLRQRLNGEAGLYEAFYEAHPMLGLRNSGNHKRPFIPYSNHYFCVPQNPVPFNLLLHAELNLFKIRHCRNIAGIHRELDPYGAPTDTTSGMPVIGANGNIAFPGAVAVPPTPYRYEVVLARAKELVQLAGQAEAQLLNTLEKLDAERYSLLRARQDLGTAKATVKLQDLRVKESAHEVDLAEMQQERAQFQVETYEGWIDEGLNSYETAILDSYKKLNTLQIAMASMNAAQQALATTMAGVNFHTSALGTWVGLLSTGGTNVVAYDILMGASLAIGISQLGVNIDSINEQTSISINQMYASWEQRKRDYTFQSALSQWDVKLAGQQIQLANDRLRITGQERAIAEMQSRHAEETLEFLRTKFTNAELYDWMSGVLQRVYSFYLQHATSMAKVAQQQLAFERQEAPANLILDDYWSPPSDSANVPGVGTGSGPDRRGLTGSARLQMDLTKLDLYAFETEKRKLQLTKTMSLAQLFPAEFEVFRQTGVLNFRTRMEWFDRDFPGHYLRLVKRVRTSVIALVPPGEGIRARLATTGVSRVVVGGDSFQTIVTRRGSESVSLTSPIEATGLFEMLPDRGDMLYPFEGMGVDAPWEFRMYRAANPINFNTIADVLVTFEYTALESFDYEQQVIQSFDNVLHGERAFSFKYLFPDQWYDLRNAALTATPYVVDFELRKGDFPGLGHLQVESVTVMLVTQAQGGAELHQLELWRQDAGGVDYTVGGIGVANAAGVISTRSGSWTGFLNNQSPVGKWKLNCSGARLGDPLAVMSPSVSDLIGDLDAPLVDILLIVGYKGDSPGYR